MSNGYISIKEAAKLLNVCTNTVYKWSKSGQLPAVKIGGQWFISKEELDRLITNKGAGSEHAAEVGNTVEERAQVADPAPEM